MNKRVKFAVVGCGHIGKRHAEMISRNPEAKLVALIDVKEKESLGIDNFDVPFFNSLEAFLSSEIEVDVINIATPNGFHAEQGLKVLESNCHLVIEKPMALSSEDAKKMILKSEEVQKKIFCVMQNRYSPPSKWLKELIESKRLGEIFMVQINCFWNRDERYYTSDSWHGKKDLDGGTLFTQFSHFIDLLYWYFGDVKNIKAKFADFNHSKLTEFEDSGFVRFDFEKGGIGSFNYSTSVWNKNLESSITIIAEKGSVKVGGQYMNDVEYCNVKDYAMPILEPVNSANDYGAYKGSAANHRFVIENIIEVLNNKTKMTTNVEDGLKVVEIIEKIYATKNIF